MTPFSLLETNSDHFSSCCKILVVSTEWDNAVWTWSWTSLTNNKFLGKVRMWEEEKTFPIENKENNFETGCLSWTWSDFQFITSQLNKLREIKPFKFCLPLRKFLLKYNLYKEVHKSQQRIIWWISQSKHIWATNTQIKCRNVTSTWEAPLLHEPPTPSQAITTLLSNTTGMFYLFLNYIRWDHTVYNLLWVASFIHHYFCEIHLFYYIIQKLIHSLLQYAIVWICHNVFTHVLPTRVWVVSSSGPLQLALLRTLVSISITECMHIYLLNVCRELRSHRAAHIQLE